MSIVAATRYWYPSIARSIQENPGALDQAWYLSNLLDKHCFVAFVTNITYVAWIRIRTPKRKSKHHHPASDSRRSSEDPVYYTDCILYRDPNRSQLYGSQATTRPWVAPTREKPLILEQDWPKSGIWGIFVETTTILPQKHVVSENFMSRDHIMNCCLFHLREFAQVLFLPWSKILTDLVEKYWPRVSETIFVRHNQRSVVTEVFFAVGQLLDK